MKWFMVVGMFLMSATAAQAKPEVRGAFEWVLVEPVIGTYNITAFQFEMEVATLGPVDIGWSFRKEGAGFADGWGLGVHASRNWREGKRIGLITQGGVRWFMPGEYYSRFEFRERGGELYWQRWETISLNAKLPFFSESSNPAEAAAMAPTFGVFAEYDVKGFKVRVGIRATAARYLLKVAHRPVSGQDMIGLRDEAFWKVILAPTITIGF